MQGRFQETCCPHNVGAASEDMLPEDAGGVSEDVLPANAEAASEDVLPANAGAASEDVLPADAKAASEDVLPAGQDVVLGDVLFAEQDIPQPPQVQTPEIANQDQPLLEQFAPDVAAPAVLLDAAMDMMLTQKKLDQQRCGVIQSFCSCRCACWHPENV